MAIVSAAAFVAALVLGSGQPPTPAPPRIVPWFLSRNVEEGPAFLIECRNTTAAPIDSGSMFWALDQDDFRIDGIGLEPRGRMGPGLVSEIPAGASWRGIVELRQAEPQNGYAVALGANTRSTLVVPLDAGPHTIAVRCGDVWSDDVVFYWER
jgi:hypothetical protein